GNHVTALKPDQVRITEDGIAQKMVLFKEAGQTPLRLSATPADVLSGTSVFVLFDTSNGMYKGFSYASDAIAKPLYMPLLVSKRTNTLVPLSTSAGVAESRSGVWPASLKRTIFCAIPSSVIRTWSGFKAVT